MNKSKKNKNGRFCLKQDEDTHWYLIPVELMDRFDHMEEKAYKQDNFDDFEKMFGKYRMNGPYNITFENPLNNNGDKFTFLTK